MLVVTNDLQDHVLYCEGMLLFHRSIRLGYNVLMLDSDVSIMDDPYKYFKQPPFQELTVINQAESPVHPNGGVLYVQNAAPEGPAAFMFAGKLCSDCTPFVMYGSLRHN